MFFIVGRIGFLFEVEDLNLDLKISSKLIQTKFFVIFVDSSKIVGNIVVGSCVFFKREECAYFFMNKFGDFDRLHILDNSIFKYAKISVSDKRMVDFEFLTFWISGKDYRELRESLIVREFYEHFEDELKQRVLDFLKYFKLAVTKNIDK